MASPKTPAKEASADSAAASSTPDVALVHSVTPEGEVHIIRRRGDQLEAGALQPLREGVPIQGEVVSLKPRPNFPLLCDVQTLYAPPRAAAPAASAAAPGPDKPARPARRKGPAQVATDEYRANWDSIWSSSKKRDALN
ncbi:MAG TPA: hypothetical protein VHB79_01730 [Polyangiaceae bacterium]|nr:hypothetical protein [Polyangiaceae bacterium]